ncbi:MAG: GDSL-type esterase/lipase family protein [Solirubrobacteraceae bacterium]|nr:GDSL-type esterase/lipase family protein [Solirubrobacteraceae bacterium]
MQLRRSVRLAALAASVAVGLCGAATPGQAQAPRSMAALGDSLSVGLYSGAPCLPAALCPQNSWSTGTNAAVDSHVLRLARLGAAPTAHNFAVSGVKVIDLGSANNQAQKAINAGVEYVTIMIGLNDSCRETVAAMTSVATFRAQFAAGLGKLVAGLPGARILVASIPDVERLRMILKDSPSARAEWAAKQVCSVLLEDPLSTAPAVVVRRAAARQRAIDFNRQLEEVCAQYPTCRYDDGAVFGWAFQPAHFGTYDYFHLSAAGQAGLAALTYPLAFPSASAPPPIVTPPPAVADPPPPPAARFPAKLKLKRAAIAGGRLDALLGVSGRATGALRVEYHSAATTRVFRVALGPAREGEKNVKLLRALSGAQRRTPTGILTVTYSGNQRVLGDLLRARAANRRSLLRRTSLSLAGARLRVAGTVAPAVRGVVRLRVTYTDASGAGAEWSHAARIAAGRWRADRALPAAASTDPNAYLTLQFTGDLAARGGPHRGEQDGRGLGNLPVS